MLSPRLAVTAGPGRRRRRQGHSGGMDWDPRGSLGASAQPGPQGRGSGPGGDGSQSQSWLDTERWEDGQVDVQGELHQGGSDGTDLAVT